MQPIMHHIIIRGPKQKKNPFENLKSLAANRLIIVALVVFVAGLAVLGYSRSVGYQTYDNITQSQSGTLFTGNYANVSFSSIANYPTNINFTFSHLNTPVHYELFKYNEYRNVQGVTITQSVLTGSGNVSSGNSIDLQPLPYSQNYYMHLYQNASDNITYYVKTTTTIPHMQYGDPSIGIPALLVTIAGAFLLAGALTVGLRQK